ncbi:MFS transporter [uncultured Erythrobacter sp.]|uniref:MFS transporter n=1 Tax=uncultured Erythrobacter sp. TaxID=263913 RepID=UPI00262C3499|nr:MFS transporter [uncultured Erythrobacter sp.]
MSQVTVEAGPNAPAFLTRRQEFALAVSISVVCANAYYIHPIISEVADTFGVGKAEIGIVPALNQLALALGIFLLLPLGDRYSNRRLSLIFVCAQTVFLLGMAISDSFALFTLASTLLGFVTIAPYLIPAFVSKRVGPERLGEVTALLTSGLVFGVLFSRVGAGIIAETFGWRTVYWGAVGLMAAVSVLLPLIMRTENKQSSEASKGSTQSYGALLASVFTLAKSNRDMLWSGLIQGLNFGSFIAVWLGLALHITSDAMGYGVDTVSYLAGIAIVSIIMTPRLGLWADRVGAKRARWFASVVQLVGIALLYPMGWSVWTLIVPLVIINAVGPSIDVTGRMTFLSLEPENRTRLSTTYIVIMFVGGALGSILGTSVYDWGGWAGTCALVGLMSFSILTLSFVSHRAARSHT